jgi:hypothetical protein
MAYISAKEAAGKWSISRRRVQLLCGQGRIDGAFQIGKVWVIPQNAEKPKDARIVTGKYCRSSRNNSDKSDYH